MTDVYAILIEDWQLRLLASITYLYASGIDLLRSFDQLDLSIACLQKEQRWPSIAMWQAPLLQT